MRRPAIFDWAAPVGTNGGAGESKGDDVADMSEDDVVDVVNDDVVDVVNDVIPDEVLDRLKTEATGAWPRSEWIALRACFRRNTPFGAKRPPTNRLYCPDNDRQFSKYYTFKREKIGTSVHYFLSLDDADRKMVLEELLEMVNKVFDAFINIRYTITKDKQSNPRAYTAWNPRTVGGNDFQVKYKQKAISGPGKESN